MKIKSFFVGIITFVVFIIFILYVDGAIVNFVINSLAANSDANVILLVKVISWIALFWLTGGFAFIIGLLIAFFLGALVESL